MVKDPKLVIARKRKRASLPDTDGEVQSSDVLESSNVPTMPPPRSSTVGEPLREVIPQFYFPNGRPPTGEMRDRCLFMIDQFFSDHLDGVPKEVFRDVAKDICEIPAYFSSSMFRKIDSNHTGVVTRDAFIDYWVNSNLITNDFATQVYRILKQPERNYLTQDDFNPVLQDLLAIHPGLKFLQNAPVLQERYAKTTVYRIFYHMNRSGDGHLTLRDLKHGNLIAAMSLIDKKSVSELVSFFSHEHFHVIWSKFSELDTDHDLLIDAKDLKRYGNSMLSEKIVERIFSQTARKFASEVEGKMGYEDFLYFILSEVDKTSEPSITYWFNCIDLDGNGVLTHNELQFFYEEQIVRFNARHLKPPKFEDILCEMIDMIGPEKVTHFTLRDMKKSKLSGHVFNILFNLRKHLDFRNMDQSLTGHDEPDLTEWDRFVFKEYDKIYNHD